MPRTRFTQFNISEKEPSGSFQTVEKAVRPQGIKDKETNIKNSHAGNKRKTFIENALRFLAFSVFALWRTPVRRRMQKRKIYLPFSTSASVSRLSRHAGRTGEMPVRFLCGATMHQYQSLAYCRCTTVANQNAVISKKRGQRTNNSLSFYCLKASYSIKYQKPSLKVCLGGFSLFCE